MKNILFKAVAFSIVAQANIWTALRQNPKDKVPETKTVTLSVDEKSEQFDGMAELFRNENQGGLGRQLAVAKEVDLVADLNAAAAPAAAAAAAAFPVVKSEDEKAGWTVLGLIGSVVAAPFRLLAYPFTRNSAVPKETNDAADAPKSASALAANSSEQK